MNTDDPQFRFAVVMAILQGESILTDICQEYGLDADVVAGWKAMFLATVPNVFLSAKSTSPARSNLKSMVTPWFDRDEGVWQRVFSSGRPDVV